MSHVETASSAILSSYFDLLTASKQTTHFEKLTKWHKAKFELEIVVLPMLAQQQSKDFFV